MDDQLPLFDLPEIERPFRSPSFRGINHPVWTENKAKLIERYLYYFVLVTKHGTYIDGFAGPQSSRNHNMWAAKLVLEIQPDWLGPFFLCENNARQFHELESLKGNHPDRNISLYNNDFNESVVDILGSGKIGEKTATFCLLDQRTFECKWSTVEALAQHDKAQYKIELFYFLGIGWMHRALSQQKDESVLDAWWGGNNWKSLRNKKGYEIADLICARLTKEHGYAYATPWPIYQREEGRGAVMYYMIHATDHPAAPPLMDRAYRGIVADKESLDQLELEFAEWQQSEGR